MKPFDINLAKQGKPVCTRDGRDVRILCFDADNANYPIVALVRDVNKKNGKTYEHPQTYTSNGMLMANEREVNDDLMMATEKKKGYIALYKPRTLNTTFSLVTSYVYETLELLETYTDKEERIAIKEVEWEE